MFQIRRTGSVFQAAGVLWLLVFLYIFDKHNTALMLLAIIFAIKNGTLMGLNNNYFIYYAKPSGITVQ